MTNKTVNKKVLRAMSIGLAAMMTVQPVLATPVFADGEVEVTNLEPVVEESKQDNSFTSNDTAEALEPVQQAANDAQSATNSVGGSLDVAVSWGRDDDNQPFDNNRGHVLNAAEDAVIAIDGANSGIINANVAGDRATVATAADTLVKQAKREDGIYVLDAYEEMQKANVAFSENGDVTKKAAELDKALSDESKKLVTLESNTIEVENKIEEKEISVNAANGEINSATTIPQATTAVEGARTDKQEADDLYDGALTNYNTANSEYDEAVKNVASLKEDYKKLLAAQIDDKSAIIEAQRELNDAMTNLKALENAAKDAQKNLSNTVISKIANNNNLDWDELDKVFNDVIKYYYFPEVEKINSANVRIGKTVKDKDNDRNNYIIVYVKDENGVEKERYFNYICTNQDENSNNFDVNISNKKLGNMVIFEKNDRYEDSTGNKVDVREAMEISHVSESEVVVETKDNTTTYYKVGQAGVEETKLTNNAVEAEDGKSGVSETYDISSSSYEIKEIDGETKLVKTTTADVTTTTFEKNVSLTAEEAKSYGGYDSYAAAIGDAQSKATALVNNEITGTAYSLQGGENDVTYESSVSAEVSTTAEVEYKTKFTTTIDLTGLRANYDRSYLDEALELVNKIPGINIDTYSDKEISDIKEAISTQLKGGIIDAIKRAGYDISDDAAVVSGLLVDSAKDEVFGKNQYVVSGGSLTFTYYSKSSSIAEGNGTDTQSGLEADADTTTAKSEAKQDAVDNAVAETLSMQGETFTSLLNCELKGRQIFEGYSGKILFVPVTIPEVYKPMSLVYDADASVKPTVSSTSQIVNADGVALTATDAEVTGSSVEYTLTLSGVNYDRQSSEINKNKEVSTQSWDVGALTNKGHFENDTYYDYLENKDNQSGKIVDLADGNNVVTAKYNRDVKSNYATVKNLADQYKNVEKAAAAAQTKVETAQTKVQDLIDAIKAAMSEDNLDKAVNARIGQLAAQLKVAKAELDEAKENRDAVERALAEAEEAYRLAVIRLTPAPEESGESSESSGDTTPYTPVYAAIAEAPAAAIPVVIPAGSEVGVAGARRSGNGAGSAKVEKAASDTQAKLPVVEKDESALKITDEVIKTIKDADVPLASFAEEEKASMNWWWLLVVAALGATGEELYRRNKKKKEEQAALKAEINKEK